MKVINEKDYVYMGFLDGWHTFQSNPDKSNFDKEIIKIERARFVKKDGSSKILNKA